MTEAKKLTQAEFNDACANTRNEWRMYTCPIMGGKLCKVEACAAWYEGYHDGNRSLACGCSSPLITGIITIEQ